MTSLDDSFKEFEENVGNPRNRSRTIVPPVYDEILQELWNDPVIHGFGSELLRYEFESISDVVTPNYAKRIAAGDVINNPCTYSSDAQEFQGESSYYAYQILDPSKWFRVTGGNLAQRIRDKVNVVPISFDISKLKSESKVKAISNMDRTPYAFGEDIGELKETIRFMKSPMSSLAKLAKSIRRKAQKRNNARLASLKGRKYIRDKSAENSDIGADIASVYAEEQWALEPLVRSVHDAIEAFSKVNVPHLKRYTARGFANFDESNHDSLTTEGTSNWHLDYSEHVNIKVHSGILYSITNPVYDIRSRMGLRGKDLPETLWQLLPLSFMVDRMLDVSTFTRAVVNMSDPSLKILTGWCTVHSLKEYSYTPTGRDPNSLWAFTVQSCTCTKHNFAYDRAPWTPKVSDLNIPVNLTGLIDDAKNIADLAAVVIQQLR